MPARGARGRGATPTRGGSRGRSGSSPSAEAGATAEPEPKTEAPPPADPDPKKKGSKPPKPPVPTIPTAPVVPQAAPQAPSAPAVVAPASPAAPPAPAPVPSPSPAAAPAPSPQPPAVAPSPAPAPAPPPSAAAEPHRHREGGPTPNYTDEPEPKVEADHDLPRVDLAPFPAASTGGSRVAVEPATYGSLAQVIEGAREGSTITLPAGVYTESVKITKALNFVGNGRASLRGDGSAETLVVEVPEGKVVTFRGLSIKQKLNKAKAAATIVSGAVSFDNCAIRSIGVASITVKGSAKLQLTRCAVKAASSPGVNMMDGSQVNAIGCVFSDSKTIAVTLKKTSVGVFTQCVFKDLAKGGISASDKTQLYVDSCRFIDCNIDIGNDTQNVVTGCYIKKEKVVTAETGQVTISPGIICAVGSRAHVYSTTMASAGIDARDDSVVALQANRFVDGELIVWNKSQVTSRDDSFKGQTPTAISVLNEAKLNLAGLRIEGVSEYGIVAQGQCEITIADVHIAGSGKTGVMVFDGVSLSIARGDIIGAKEHGVLARDAGAVSLADITVADCGGSGIEISGGGSTLKQIVFRSNKRCGLVVIESKATVVAPTFDSNAYSGLHLEKAQVEIDGGSFVKNAKGAIYLSKSSELQLLGGATFAENRWAAVYVEPGSSFTGRDVKFLKNQVGVAISGKGTLTNATFVENEATALQVAGPEATVEVKESKFEKEKQAVVAADGARLTLTRCILTQNTLHLLSANGATVVDDAGEYTGAEGDYGVHIVEGTATFGQSKFANSKAVAVFAQGEVNMDKAVVEHSGQFGVVCSGRASGLIQGSTFTKNGVAGFQIVEGAPEIKDCTISGNSKYAIFIADVARPLIRANKFSDNGFQNVWRI